MDLEKKRLIKTKDSKVKELKKLLDKEVERLIHPTTGLLEEVNLTPAQETNKPVTNSNDVTSEVDINYRVLGKSSSDHLEEVPFPNNKNDFKTKEHEKESPKENSFKVK